jgi:hypothetical protein
MRNDTPHCMERKWVFCVCFFLLLVSRQALGPSRTASTFSSSSVGTVASCHHLTRHTDLNRDVAHLASSRGHELEIASGARTRGNGGGTESTNSEFVRIPSRRFSTKVAALCMRM